MQNRGHGFHLDPAHPNCVAPGRRPFHTIIPAFHTKDGQPQMSFGVMGGNMQPQGHLQTLVRMIDYDQSPQAACDAPRWRFNAGMEINVEQQMDPGVVRELSARGRAVSRRLRGGQRCAPRRPGRGILDGPRAPSLRVVAAPRGGRRPPWGRPGAGLEGPHASPFRVGRCPAAHVKPG